MTDPAEMQEQRRLALALDGLGLTLVGITPGDAPASDEDQAKAIRKAIISIRRGGGEDVDLNY